MNKLVLKIYFVILSVMLLYPSARASRPGDWMTYKNFKNDVIYYLIVDRFYDGYRGNNVPLWAFPGKSELHAWHRKRLPLMFDFDRDLLLHDPAFLKTDVQGEIDTAEKAAAFAFDISDPNRALRIISELNTLNRNKKNDALALMQGGDIQGIIDKLDYLSDLGVTLIMLNPVFDNLTGVMKRGDGTATSAYHGYWTTDWYRLDEHYSNGYTEFLRAYPEVKRPFFDMAIKSSVVTPRIRNLLSNLKNDDVIYDVLAFILASDDDLFLKFVNICLPLARAVNNPVIKARAMQVENLLKKIEGKEKSDLTELRLRFIDLSDDHLVLRLVREAESRGMRILLDFPVNSGPADDDPDRDGKANYEMLERPVIYLDREIVRSPEGKIIGVYDHDNVSEFFHGYIKNGKRTDRVIDFSKRFVPRYELENYKLHNLPDLNHENRIVREYLFNAMRKWTALGVAGYRLDAAQHVSSEFICRLEENITEVDPDVILIAEYFLGGADNRRSLEWMRRVGECSAKWRMERYKWNRILGSGTSVTLFDFSFAFPARKFFAGITDPQGRLSQVRGVVTLDENIVTSGWIAYMDEDEPMEFVTLLENHDMKPMRGAFGSELSEGDYISAVEFMFLSRGIPMIYYGMEQDNYAPYNFLKGVNGITHDYLFRLPMDWRKFDPSRDVFSAYKKLAKLRRKNKALRYGTTRFLSWEDGMPLHLTNTDCLAFERKYMDVNETHLAFYFYSRKRRAFRIKTSFTPGDYLDPITGRRYVVEDGGWVTIFAEPGRAVVLEEIVKNKENNENKE